MVSYSHFKCKVVSLVKVFIVTPKIGPINTDLESQATCYLTDFKGIPPWIELSMHIQEMITQHIPSFYKDGQRGIEEGTKHQQGGN